ncbi:MAG: hypothetical protein MUC59_15625 [Saprospiraceae bacterium]|nr:hypothetical protein [Saprospiraceae bacterium]
MNPLIAAAQYPITYHASFKAWALHVEKWVKNAAQKGVQLLLFPEYGAMELVSLFPKETQNDLRAQVLELGTLEADFCGVYAGLASKYGMVIVAPSIPLQVSDRIHNRAFVFSKNGLVGYQDKFFMTRFENEDWGIHSAPKLLTVFEADWGCFGIQVCYDAEFAIGTDLLCKAGANLILVPSCTETIRGATRVHVGARARALEGQCYTVVSQTIGMAAWSPAVDISFSTTSGSADTCPLEP